MNYYILLGPPGAGKGTQAGLIVEKYGYLHISTGDLLRNEIAKGTELGKAASEIINRGDLVSDEIVIGMIRNRIESGKDAKGFLFDGFPRTIAQAEALDRMLADFGGEVSAAISINLDDRLIFERIRHRAMIEDRKDDTDPVTIGHRISNYHEKTEPLISYYRRQGKLRDIQGNDSIDNVFQSISAIIQ